MKKLILAPAMICVGWLCMFQVADALYVNGGSREADTEYHRIVVKLRSDLKINRELGKGSNTQIGIPEIDELSQQLGVTCKGRALSRAPVSRLDSRFRNIILLEASDGQDLSTLVGDYESLDCVEYAFLDRPVELYKSPNDSLYVHQWALNNTGQACYHVERYDGGHNDVLVLESGTPDADIDADEVYQNPPDHVSTVVVAIVDTGVDPNHPDLQGNLWTNPGEIPDDGIDNDRNGYIDDVVGWDFAGDGYFDPPDNDPTDEYGHGTHCSGIVASVTNNNRGVAGILPDCKIMALSFYPLMFASWAAEAIIYAADNGADVINMSWGLPFDVPLWEDALNYAKEKGVILCAAAGNDGEERINYPAGYTNNLAVSATTKFDEVADFSTYGSIINVCAPGYSILSLRAAGTDLYGPSESGVHIIDNYYYLASGTSMAAPHVTGVSAYLRAVSPGIKVDEAYSIIEQSADDYIDPLGDGGNYPGWDIYSGYGRLNLNQALAMAPAISADISSPLNHDPVSGIVAVNGTASGAEFTSFILDYGPGNTPNSWAEISSSDVPVTDGLLGEWDTGDLNGPHTLRLRIGATNEDRVTVNLVNGVLVEIVSPEPGDTIVGYKDVVVSASCPNFFLAHLEYGVGSSPTSWTSICQTATPLLEDNICQWSTGGLDAGLYTLQLSVYSTYGLEGTATVTVELTGSLFSDGTGWTVSLAGAPSLIPNYGDFDGDGINEIVVGTSSGIKYYSPDGTEKTAGMQSVPNYDFRVPISVGDLDDDDLDDLVAVSASPAKLYILYGNGTQTESDLPVGPDNSWFVSDDEPNWPSLSLVDLNNDGRDEIIFCPGVETATWDFYVFTSDGQPWGDASPIVDNTSGSFFAADVDGDQYCEFYYTDNARIIQIDSLGNELAAVQVASGELTFVSRSMTACDIDDDGKVELIVIGFTNTYGPNQDNYLIWAFDENLQIKDGWPHDTGVTGFYILHPPVFGDLNNDRQLEYVSSFWDLYSGFVYAWDLDGEPFIGYTGRIAGTIDGAAVAAVILADLDGNHTTEILSSQYPAPFSSYEEQAMPAWDHSGEMLPGWPIITDIDVGPSPDGCNIAVVGDLDDDGNLDLFSTTYNGNLIFTEFAGVEYDELFSPCPQWRYNRRHNGIKDTEWPGLAPCGNVDGFGDVDVDDAVYLISYIFGSGYPPIDEAGGDVDCSGGTDIDDVVYLIMYVFLEGPAPCANCP